MTGVSGPAPLDGSALALVDRHDLVLLDLDGVVYLGDQPVPGAAEALTRVRAAGTAVHFVTNNASGRAEQVVERLGRCGVDARPDEVTTSAQGAAAMLAQRSAPGSVVLVVGTDALAAEVAEAGLRPTRSADDDPVAVVQGFGPGVDWRQLAEAAVAVRHGADWVATNLDETLPSPRGPLPGNGALVGALATGLGRRPDRVVGKPQPALFDEAARRRAGERPVVVGDRLDTDIEGAVRAGMPGLLVLTGVTGPAELLAAPPECRPRYLAWDLAGLLVPHPAVYVGSDGAAGCGGWRAAPRQGRVLLEGSGQPLDALRAACVASWRGGCRAPVEAATAAAERVVATWR